MVMSPNCTSWSEPLTRMGAVQVARSGVHRTANRLAVKSRGPGPVAVKSVYVIHTCSPSPVSPTSNHGLSRKCVGSGAAATSRRLGQHAGDAPPGHEARVAGELR